MMMKSFAFAVSMLLLTASSAFTVTTQQPSSTSGSTTTRLHLFGGGNKGGEEGAKKAPGMMDQLAMFKKAQEMAQKKKKLDEELQQMDFVGTADGSKVTVHMKYVPIYNPMDPNPEYEAAKFEFDDDFYESSDASEIAEACKSALTNGIEVVNQAVAEKYVTLQSDLMAALGQQAPPPPQQQ